MDQIGQPVQRVRVPAASILLAALLWLVSGLSAQDPKPASEYDVKANFLLHFTQFVDWPPSAFEDAHSPFRICILGDDPFGSAMDDLVKGESRLGRKLVIDRIRRLPEHKSCQVLFVRQLPKDVSKALSNLPPGILTVGEGNDFLREGGVIAFVVENRHVRFDVSQKAAAAEQLTISSRMLSVAREVQR